MLWKEYVRESCENFSDYSRDNNKKHVHNGCYLEEHLFEDFNSFMTKVSTTERPVNWSAQKKNSKNFIDKTYGKDPKQREHYWTRTLKIYSLFELNAETNVWPTPFS